MVPGAQAQLVDIRTARDLGTATNHNAHVLQMQQRRTTDLVSRLAAENVVLEIAGTGCVRVDRHFKAADQGLSSSGRQTHVCVEPHDEDRLTTASSARWSCAAGAAKCS